MVVTATLLVVENEAAIAALVQMALERHGYLVLTAASGSEALRLAASHKGPIDLLHASGSCRLHPETLLTQHADGEGT